MSRKRPSNHRESVDRTYQYRYAELPRGAVLSASFYKTAGGNEPVREFLLALSRDERRTIGTDIKEVQFGWPLGMPLVRKMEPGLWEIRSQLDGRIARMLFTVHGNCMVLLHAFIKKSRQTPKSDLDTARQRRIDINEDSHG